jgi:ribosomal protein L10
MQEIEDLKLLVRQLTRNEEGERARFKRGVFNFIGGISKILFGTMDNEDASYYAEKISNLEKEQIDFLKLSKEQITVVKSTLRSLNSSLLAVSENERVLSKGLEEMAKHINEQDGEIKDMFTGASMLLTVNEHNMQLQRALDECRREYNVLIDAVMNSQKGILQPHIITPAQILKQLKASQADLPSDLVTSH